jgi:SRSO17 transposase
MYEGMEPLALIQPLPVSTPCSRRETPASDRPEAVVWSLDKLAERLCIFHARYTLFFITRTRSVVELSKQYLFGLIQSEKRNMERMAEVVPDSNDQAYQHFMSKSPWDHRAVLHQIASDVDAAIGDSEDCFLIIDESGFAKKGKKSVGVARQWNGRLGKVDNCQVGVFAALGCGDEVSLINERLYLPQEWVDDQGGSERRSSVEGP